MMKATMTDVEKAIEQLGRGAVGEDGDGARSFSFASTRDGGPDTENSDTDFDMSDLDAADAITNDGEDWHKGARRKLAAKAKRAVEEAEKLEAMIGENGRRAIAPPIEVELSDESEAEDDPDFTKSSRFQRIPEEDEDIGADGETPAVTNGTQHSTITTLSTAEAQVLVPPQDETDVPTATKLSFSALQTPVPTNSPPEKPEQPEERSPTDIYPSPISPPPTTLPNVSTIQQTLKRSSTPAREIVHEHSSKHNSAPSMSMSPLQQQPVATDTTEFPTPASIPMSSPQGRNQTLPMEWSVDEVVDWLKNKGFDQDVCDKFVGEYIILHYLTQQYQSNLFSYYK